MQDLEFTNIVLGIFVSILTIAGIGGYVIYRFKKSKQRAGESGINNESEGETANVTRSALRGGDGTINVIGSNNTVVANHIEAPGGEEASNPTINLKQTCQILFIDDEKTPSVIRTLRKSGWKYIKKIGDTADLDMAEIRNANIIFVDIKDCGKELGFKNEGVGLAAQLKRKYPEKGVVIYSATVEHNLFDPDINIVDDRLYKNAEPIQFSNMIERYGKPKNKHITN